MDNNWNKKEFLAFSLLYAAHADIEFSDSEKTKIKSLVDDKTYDDLYATFLSMSDYTALQTIISYKAQYFPTVDHKQELLSNMEDLFQVDGDYSIMEKDMLVFLDRFI